MADELDTLEKLVLAMMDSSSEIPKIISKLGIMSDERLKHLSRMGSNIMQLVAVEQARRGSDV